MTCPPRITLSSSPRRPRGQHPRAFSLVELLVVIAIIIALLGALLAALALAGRRAQSAQTQTLLTSISNGLTAFQTDVGYLPPVLGKAPWTAGAQTVNNARDYMVQPAWTLAPNGSPDATSVDRLQRWYSYTSLPEYLLGYGDRTQDGNGAYQGQTTPAGSPGAREPLLGIRHPGADGYWNGVINPRPGGAPGTLLSRNPLDLTAPYNVNVANGAMVQGKVFGPYLQLADSANIGGIKGYDANGEPIIVTAGEDPTFPSLPKVFIDYWGSPISYYRRPYIVPDLKSFERYGSNQVGRDLGDIFALRPSEYRPGEDLAGVNDAAGDGSTLGRLKSANFAILSRGADKSWDRTTRRDENGFNRDNIVEAGQ